MFRGDHDPAYKEGICRRGEADTLNNVTNEFDNVYNKIEYVGIKIEDPDRISNEDKQSNVTTFNHNGEKNDAWNKGLSNSLRLYSKCIKLEEADSYEPSWEKETSNDMGCNTGDAHNKIEYIDIKMEDPDSDSTYLEEDGNNEHDVSRESCNSEDVEHSHIFKQMIKGETDDNLDNHEQHTDINSKNNKERLTSTDLGCTGEHNFTYAPHFINQDKHSDNQPKCDAYNERSVTSNSLKLLQTDDKSNNGFTQSDNLTKRELTNAGDKSYKCDVCKKKFISSSKLARHIRTHNNERPHKCDECNKEFVNSTNFATHKLTHTGEKPYKCDKCNKRFLRSDYLAKHKLTHTGERPYMCQVCNKGFTQSSKLAAHKLIHTGEKPYQCDVCNNRFTHSSTLVIHKLTHTGEKRYKCEVCNKRFTTSSSIARHKRIHTGEKPYKCDVCEKGFIVSSKLATHKLTHTGARPYKCDLCKKGFTTSTSLATHKFIHTGEKPYQCNLCNKRFTQSGNLSSHKLTHTGEKPHKCDICNKRFTTSSYLAIHKFVHIEKNQFETTSQKVTD